MIKPILIKIRVASDNTGNYYISKEFDTIEEAIEYLKEYE